MKSALDALGNHFVGSVNRTFERFQFNQRAQQDGESFDQYLMALQTLIQTCQYRTLSDELLCDRIVCGICDDRVRSSLLQCKKLTLEDCLEKCRASEATAGLVKQMSLRPANDHQRGQSIVTETNMEVHAMGPQRPRQSGRRTESNQRPKIKLDEICQRCGRHHGNSHRCPAMGQEC